MGAFIYKDGSVYIKYEPLSVIPPNMVSIASLVATAALACFNDNAFWYTCTWRGNRQQVGFDVYQPFA